MDEELHAVFRPHPPLPFANLRDQQHLEIDPIRIDAIIYAIVRFDPVSVHIARVRLLCAEASVNEYVLNASRPKCTDGGPQSLQEPTPPRRESEPPSYLQLLPDDCQAEARQLPGRKAESRHLHHLRNNEQCQHQCCHWTIPLFAGGLITSPCGSRPAIRASTLEVTASINAMLHPGSKR